MIKLKMMVCMVALMILIAKQLFCYYHRYYLSIDFFIFGTPLKFVVGENLKFNECCIQELQSSAESTFLQKKKMKERLQTYMYCVRLYHHNLKNKKSLFLTSSVLLHHSRDNPHGMCI